MIAFACAVVSQASALSPAIPTVVRVCANFTADSAQLDDESKAALINLRNFIEMRDEQMRPSIRVEMLYPAQIRRDTKHDTSTVIDLSTKRQSEIIRLIFDESQKQVPSWWFHFNEFQQGWDCNASVDANYYGKNAQAICKTKDYCGIRCTSQGCAEAP